MHALHGSPHISEICETEVSKYLQIIGGGEQMKGSFKLVMILGLTSGFAQ